MTRIVIDAPASVEESVTVAPDERVLVGRAPDAAMIPGEALPAGASIRSLIISGQSVSANHLLISRTPDQLELRDLDSRNGTWVRIPPSATLPLPGWAEVHLRLAARPAAAGAEDSPPDITTAERRSYGKAVARAVAEWLERRRVVGQVRALPRRTRDLAGRPTDPIPLEDGGELHVQIDQTTDAASDLLAAIWRYVLRQNSRLAAVEAARADGLILASEPFRRAHRESIEAAAHGAQNLLLLGPTGCGKGKLAQAFHRHTGRAGRFVAVNCGELIKDRLQADLFGAEVGSFSGCVRRIAGAVEEAEGGTLFLDEIGELHLDIQAMLLTFVESRAYTRMGLSGRPRHADIRLVAGTNRDLKQGARAGSFRADLWFRLSEEQVVQVPPLRERFDDVIAYLRATPRGEVSALDALSPRALDWLRNHRWDGNFRELVGFVRRLPAVAAAGSISLDEARRCLELSALSLPDEDASAAQRGPAARHQDADGGDFDRLAARAMERFLDDHDHTAPTNWSDTVTFLEQYLKPLLLATMAGAEAKPTYDETWSPDLPRRVGADRGTVQKQLRRYFECYRKPGNTQ